MRKLPKAQLTFFITVVVAGQLAQYLAAQDSAAQDTVEFLSGATLEGKVTDIRTADKEFDFESMFGTRKISKTYKFSEVHAVTLAGKRHVLTKKQQTATGNQARSAQEIRQLIDTVGASLPDWYESTPLNLPKTLDMSWPLQPVPKGWNNRLNIGQFIWDIINPNPTKWRLGVKLVHVVIESHQSSPELLERDQKALGRMYFRLLQDYPRAAYWLEQSDAPVGTPENVMLAECYYRLGNKDMAVALVKGDRLPQAAIKLLAELGDLPAALKLADRFRGSSAEPNAMLLAGDALRNAGKFDAAIERYTMVLKSDKARNKDYRERFCNRAQDSIDAIKLAEKADVSKVADGTYTGSGAGYNGALQVSVTVAAHKITEVAVLKHREKQFYSALEDTPKQILDKQSVQGIDGFSGATITSAAIVNASAQALAKGAQ